VDAVLDLLIDGETGLWHLANQGAVTWAEFARAIARVFTLSEGLVLPTSSQRLGWAAQRPKYAALASSRGQLLPTLEQGLAKHAAIMMAAHSPEAWVQPGIMAPAE
jgi:dTDP-4-dehydrorhamnose reductase